MNSTEHTSSTRELLNSLAGFNADGERRVATKTRRAVLGKVLSMSEQEKTRRHARAVAIAVAIGVLFLVGPLVWYAVDELTGGGHLGDLQADMAMLLMVFIPALLAALVAASGVERYFRHRRRNF